ncbi:MAG: biopolymer transporter ExbD [Saprospiraceae bacterium]|nr:biopolymer transporter ExbD [Saprospiraceae bacterium]
MGLRRKSKVSAAFSMSSLTDIIFLLLIFFMLTSGLVAPNALNLKLPGSSRAKRAHSNQRMDNVSINESGRFAINGRSISLEELDSRLSSLANRDESITISPDSGAPVEAVVAIMDIAMRYNINGILAAERD